MSLHLPAVEKHVVLRTEEPIGVLVEEAIGIIVEGLQPLRGRARLIALHPIDKGTLILYWRR